MKGVDKSEWVLGELLMDPQKLFVLWAVKERFCVHLDDFYNHYGPDFPIARVVDALRQDGFLRQGVDDIVLTETGEQAVAYFADITAMDKHEAPELPSDEATQIETDVGESMAQNVNPKNRAGKGFSLKPNTRELLAREQLKVNQELLQEIRLVRMEHRHGATTGMIIGISAIVVAILVGLFGISWNRISVVGLGVESVKRQVKANQFVITTPVDGADVDFTDFVRGKTPFPAEINHYIVVTTSQASDWVQDIPATVVGGTFAGSARFGEASTKSGEGYIVRVLATVSRLQPGPLTTVPEDAVYSESVTVRRK